VATGGVSYVWNTGATTQSIMVSPLVSTTYTVTATDTNSCQSTAWTTITVNPLPTPAITGNSSICIGESTTLTASGGVTYIWSNSEIQNIINVSPLATTSYTVTVIDSNNCSNTSSVTIVVNDIPNITITGDSEICVGDEAI